MSANPLQPTITFVDPTERYRLQFTGSIYRTAIFLAVISPRIEGETDEGLSKKSRLYMGFLDSRMPVLPAPLDYVPTHFTSTRVPGRICKRLMTESASGEWVPRTLTGELQYLIDSSYYSRVDSEEVLDSKPIPAPGKSASSLAMDPNRNEDSTITSPLFEQLTLTMSAGTPMTRWRSSPSIHRFRHVDLSGHRANLTLMLNDGMETITVAAG